MAYVFTLWKILEKPPPQPDNTLYTLHLSPLGVHVLLITWSDRSRSFMYSETMMLTELKSISLRKFRSFAEDIKELWPDEFPLYWLPFVIIITIIPLTPYGIFFFVSKTFLFYFCFISALSWNHELVDKVDNLPVHGPFTNRQTIHLVS